MYAKYRTFAFYQSVLSECACTPYIARARDGLRELADRAQRMETKGSLLSSATVHALAFVFKRSIGDVIRNWKKPEKGKPGCRA